MAATVETFQSITTTTTTTTTKTRRRSSKGPRTAFEASAARFKGSGNGRQQQHKVPLGFHGLTWFWKTQS